ncbi:hypothetical protein ACTFIY_010330 [Dictyostelium cf. discoideum]
MRLNFIGGQNRQGPTTSSNKPSGRSVFFSWSHYTTNVDGMVNLNFSNNVNWDLINNWAGSSGTYFSGWGISTFSLNTSETILVTCSGIAKFWIDSTVMQGDSYGLGLQFNSIQLSSGTHQLKVRIIGSEAAKLSM